MIAGMACGVAVLTWVWWTAATAWTWYAFIGSSVTFAAALGASFLFSDSISSAPDSSASDRHA
jgi:hypothetical protein